MKVIIDRFEAGFAVVEMEDKSTIDMPKELIPVGAQEGDVLEIRIDKEETTERKKRLDHLMDDLWE